MERKAVVETVRLNHSNNHAEYSVKIDDIAVVNTLVTSDFWRLQDCVKYDAVKYGTDCLIYQLMPENTRSRPSILIPFGLLSIFSSRENVFVGRGIKKDIQNLQPYFRFNIDNLTVVDVRSCIAHPSFNPPDMARSSLRSLGRRVLKRDIAPKYLGTRPWNFEVLNKRQVESLAVTTFMSAKIGTTFGL